MHGNNFESFEHIQRAQLGTTMAPLQSAFGRALLAIATIVLAVFYLAPSLLTLASETSIHAESKHRPDITLHAPIPRHVIPTPTNDRRLIIVGDIHGMLSALDALLEKLDFDPKRDHLVAAGDMVSKGPDSRGVIARLMELDASAARGNHEDHVVRAWHHRKKKHHKHKGNAYETAKSLSKKQLKWLDALPAILTAEPLPLYVVHAGLVPGLRIDRQDAWAVMNMRSLVYPSSDLRRDDTDVDLETEPSSIIPDDGRAGKAWAVAWDHFQKHLPHRHRRTVVYGHDARTGYREGSHTFGLDSACVTGGELTALVVEAEGVRSSANVDRGFAHRTVSVDCKKYL